MDVRTMSDDDIIANLDSLKAQMEALKCLTNDLNNELVDRHAHTAAKVFEQEAKQCGEVTFILPNGLKFKASIDKTVKWDSKELENISSTMDWPTIQELFNIEFSIGELKYRGITDAELKARIDKARITKYGKLKITCTGKM